MSPNTFAMDPTKGGDKHGTGYIKLSKLMREVLAPEDIASIMACRMKNANLRFMFYCNENGKRIERGLTAYTKEDHPIDLKVSWAFAVFCSKCEMSHTFNFMASRKDLSDYSHMRGLTYG